MHDRNGFRSAKLGFSETGTDGGPSRPFGRSIVHLHLPQTRKMKSRTSAALLHSGCGVGSYDMLWICENGTEQSDSKCGCIKESVSQVHGGQVMITDSGC